MSPYNICDNRIDENTKIGYSKKYYILYPFICAIYIYNITNFVIYFCAYYKYLKLNLNIIR